MPLVEFKGYAPDAGPTEAGVFVDCAAVVPTQRGFKAAPAARSTGIDALSGTCLGAASLTKLDGSTRVFAGTTASLYELSSTSWVERSVTTAGYGLSADDRWRWAQFGNVSLATAKTERLQASTSGNFLVSAAAAPKASIVEVVNNFVIVFDTDETAYGDSPDRWWCSGVGDYTDWTPAVATQCVTGRLTSAPGRIRAAKRFGDRIIAFKKNAMYVGTYVGQPNSFDFQQIPGTVGALSQEVVVSVGTADNPRLIFMGSDDFYSYDGTVIPIGTNRVKELVYGELNSTYSEWCLALHDRVANLVYFYYQTADSYTPTKCVVYNYRTDKWGRDDRTVQAALEYIAPSLTYAGFGTSYSTYGDAPAVPYGSSVYVSGYQLPAVFDTSNKIVTLNGMPTVSSYTTGDIGDDNVESLLSFVKPRFITAPDSANQTNYYRQNQGDALSADATIALSDARFDVLREARWHRVLHSMNGEWESPGLWYEVERAGLE